VYLALKQAGIAQLKLHPGKAPHWLVKRMMPMASALCEFIVDEYGSKELLKRLADPVYFQAFANVPDYTGRLHSFDDSSDATRMSSDSKTTP